MGGKVVVVGMGQDNMTLPMSTVGVHELDVLGCFRYANTVRRMSRAACFFVPRGALCEAQRTSLLSAMPQPAVSSQLRPCALHFCVLADMHGAQAFSTTLPTLSPDCVVLCSQYPLCLSLLGQKKIDVTPLITHRCTARLS